MIMIFFFFFFLLFGQKTITKIERKEGLVGERKVREVTAKLSLKKTRGLSRIVKKCREREEHDRKEEQKSIYCLRIIL